MLRPVLALVVAVLLFSCVEADGPSCGFEDGTYTVTSTRLNGDCPDLPLRLVSPKAFPPECSQSFSYNDSCGVTVVRECMLDGIYGRFVATLEPRGRDYVGLYQVTLQCSGLFAVEYVTQ